MDYTDDPERVRAQAETFLAYADTQPVRAEIAIETGSTDPTPGVSFADLVATDPDGFRALLGELDGEFSAHPSYDGLVIHDFAQYFAGLHGVEPFDYVGEVPVVCDPPPALEDATAPEPVPVDRGCGCGGGAPAGWAVLLALIATRRR
jgi:hypothetical protein